MTPIAFQQWWAPRQCPHSWNAILQDVLGTFYSLVLLGAHGSPVGVKKKDPVVPPLRQPIGVKKRKTPSPTVATIVIPRSGWGVAADVSAIHCYVLIPCAYPSTSSRRLLG